MEVYNNYIKNKERIREEAIRYQCGDGEFKNANYSWSEILEWQCYFEKMGRRYGLLTEFHENGIC